MTPTWLLLVACVPRSAPPPVAVAVAPPEPVLVEPPSCGADAEIVELNTSSHRISATGLGVRLQGASHDHHEDGSSTLWLELTLWSEAGSQQWSPSALALPSTPAVILGHCVQLLEGSEEQVRLAVRPIGRSTGPLEPCPEPQVPALTDYSLAVGGHRFYLDVVRDPASGAWIPTAPLDMPMHHASRLAWLGLSAFPELSHATGVVRLVAEAQEHTIQRVAERGWIAEYEAALITVCRP